MAVKSANVLADPSAVGPIHKSLNKQEEVSKMGPYLETNRAGQPGGKAGHQSRGEGWEEQATGLSTVQRAPKFQTSDLFLVCHLDVSAGSWTNGYQNTVSLSEIGKWQLKHEVCN